MNFLKTYKNRYDFFGFFSIFFFGIGNIAFGYSFGANDLNFRCFGFAIYALCIACCFVSMHYFNKVHQFKKCANKVVNKKR